MGNSQHQENVENIIGSFQTEIMLENWSWVKAIPILL